MIKLKYVIVLSLCFLVQISAQNNTTIKALLNTLRQYELEEFNPSLNLFNPKDSLGIKLREAFIWKYNYLAFGNLEKRNFKPEKDNYTLENGLLNIYYGDYLISKGTEESIPYNYYQKSQEIADAINSPVLLCEALKRMTSIINKNEKNLDDLKNLLKKYKDAAYDDFEKDLSTLAKIRAYSYIEQKPYIQELNQGLSSALANENKTIIASYYKLLGVKHDVYARYLETNNISKNNYSKSLNYYDKSLNIWQSYNYAFSKKKQIGIIINKGIVHYFSNNQKEAQKYLNKAKESIDSTDYNNNILYYQWYSLSLAKEKKYKSAYKHKFDENQLREDRYQEKSEITVAEINTKYETEKKEKQLLIEQQQKKQNKNIAIGLGISLLFGSIIALLLFKNTRKKQRLAEQAKALESQKLATVLKEQELVSIDAMIEGQEKERQRIANDLHDDLGGLMATVKLHFNALKEKQTPDLFDKTTTLLDEAYHKIRSIAHTKNSGVIAKQGLLIALQNMADKISTSNKISVDVIDHGLENRLENSLELTIFRIVQELITNVIKHAEATEAVIHLTNHDDILNIMIEDNGKGFNPNQITTKNKGMGLSSIDKRVEHLNGKMTIESEQGSGTTIIIDIPT